MNYLEIIGKNLVHERRVQNYIDWTVLKLEQGFETESIITLVSLMLEVFPDIDLAERYFIQSIGELGLPSPIDKTAIYAYLQFYCDEVILGKVDFDFGVYELKNMCEIIENNPVLEPVYHPIMAIWYYFYEDLEMLGIGENFLFNSGLYAENSKDYTLKFILQFQYMLTIALPKNFVFSSIFMNDKEWEMRNFEGRVLYLKNTNQNLIFKS